MAATREPMLLIPRPASAPINPWPNGLLGKPCIKLGAATLVAGNAGAARPMSPTPVCQECGTASPPAWCAEASDALIDEPHFDS